MERKRRSRLLDEKGILYDVVDVGVCVEYPGHFPPVACYFSPDRRAIEGGVYNRRLVGFHIEQDIRIVVQRAHIVTNNAEHPSNVCPGIR